MVRDTRRHGGGRRLFSESEHGRAEQCRPNQSSNSASSVSASCTLTVPSMGESATPAVFPLRGFRCQPDEHEFIDCRPHVEALRNEEHTSSTFPALLKTRKWAGIVPTSCETTTRCCSAARA